MFVLMQYDINSTNYQSKLVNDKPSWNLSVLTGICCRFWTLLSLSLIVFLITMFSYNQLIIIPPANEVQGGI